MGIDLKTYIIDDDCIRTIFFEDSALLHYCIEQEVTNSLGYNSVKENFGEIGRSKKEDLIRHLGNMDLLVSYRNQVQNQLTLQSVCDMLLGLEDSYINSEELGKGLFSEITELHKVMKPSQVSLSFERLENMVKKYLSE